jgi:hypothetical protein
MSVIEAETETCCMSVIEAEAEAGSVLSRQTVLQVVCCTPAMLFGTALVEMHAFFQLCLFAHPSCSAVLENNTGYDLIGLLQ